MTFFKPPSERSRRTSEYFIKRFCIGKQSCPALFRESDRIEIELNRKAIGSLLTIHNLVANRVRTVDTKVCEQVLIIAKG